jgi:hypothetical protein
MLLDVGLMFGAGRMTNAEDRATTPGAEAQTKEHVLYQ